MSRSTSDLDPLTSLRDFQKATMVFRSGGRRPEPDRRPFYRIDDALQAYRNLLAGGADDDFFERRARSLVLFSACEAWLASRENCERYPEAHAHVYALRRKSYAVGQFAEYELRKFDVGNGVGVPAFVKELEPEVQMERRQYLALKAINPRGAPVTVLSGTSENKKIVADAIKVARHQGMSRNSFTRKGIPIDKPLEEFTGDQLVNVDEWLKHDGHRYLLKYEVAHADYINKDRRMSRLITIVNGELYGQRGHPVTTTPLRGKKLHKTAYVIDVYGNLFIGGYALRRDRKHNHHSSFLAGNTVTCAGMIGVENGRLVAMDTDSGHYRCSSEHLWAAFVILHRRGVPLRGVWAFDHQTQLRYDAEDFVQRYMDARGYKDTEYFKAHLRVR